MSEGGEFLTITKAAEELKIDRATLHRWIRQGLVKTEPRPNPRPNATRWRHWIPRTEIDRIKAGG